MVCGHHGHGLWPSAVTVEPRTQQPSRLTGFRHKIGIIQRSNTILFKQSLDESLSQWTERRSFVFSTASQQQATVDSHISQCQQLTCIYTHSCFLRPAKGSPTATNVVVVAAAAAVAVVVVVGVLNNCSQIFDLLKLFNFTTDRRRTSHTER